MGQPSHRTGERVGLGCFWLWFLFCGVAGVAGIGLLVWLAVAAIGWLNRN